MSPEQPETWGPFLSPLIFVAFWVGVLYLLGSTGGWQALASLYPDNPGLDGQTFRFRTGRLGWVGYNGCLELTAGLRGLRVATFFPFRPGHPPFVVPWEELTAQRGTRFGFSMVDFRFLRRPETVLQLPARLGEKIADASGGLLTIG